MPVLEHFIKQTNIDGTLVVKAPFSLSCSGSYFDSEGKVNSAKNKEVSLSRDKFFKEETTRRRLERTAKTGEDDDLSKKPPLADEHPPRDDVGCKILLEVENLPPSEGFESGGGVGEAGEARDREVQEVERRILDQLTSHTQANILHTINNRTRSSLHFKLLGKPHLRVDSYSIMHKRSHTSHIYISDVSSVDEAVQMVVENGESNTEGKFSPSGSVSIWRPKQVSEVEISDTKVDSANWTHEEEVVSNVKVYAPTHIIEDSDSGLKGDFQCPTLMNKIYLQGEHHSAIDLNCKLMDQLISVGLYTESGSIRVRDVWSHQISLASRLGNILCEGTVEGNLEAELQGSAHFVAAIVVGTKIKVTTECGDITLWNDCFADLAELYTNTGDIHVRYLYGCGKILIKEYGSLTVNIVEGSIAAVVKSGTMFVSIDKLTEDSFLEVEQGDITLTVPRNFPFRITVIGTNNEISPEILNSGEYFLSGEGDECFVSGVVHGPGEFQPTINVKCHNGRVILQTQKSVAKGRQLRRISQQAEDL